MREHKRNAVAAAIFASLVTTFWGFVAGESTGSQEKGTKKVQAKVIPLWPEGVPDLKADAAPEKDVGGGKFVGIHYPSLTVYAPAGPANGNGRRMRMIAARRDSGVTHRFQATTVPVATMR